MLARLKHLFLWKNLLALFGVFDRAYLFENINIVSDISVLCKFAINDTIDIYSLRCCILAIRG